MKTDQEMLESLKKRQKIYIRERNRKLRIYGTVIGCFLAVFVVIGTIPLYMQKSEKAPDTLNSDFEMRIESVRNDPAISQNSNGKKTNDVPAYEISDMSDGAVYSFDHDGEFVCVLSPEGYKDFYELIEKKTGVTMQASENEIFEIDRHVYFVCWHEEAGYCGLYGTNTTKDNFTAVYHKLTRD